MGVNGTILREYCIRCHLSAAVFLRKPSVKPIISAASRDWQAFQFSVPARCPCGGRHVAAIGVEGNLVVNCRGFDRNFQYSRSCYAAFCIGNRHAAIIHGQCAGRCYRISCYRYLRTVFIVRCHRHTGTVKAFSFRINGFRRPSCHGYGI